MPKDSALMTYSPLIRPNFPILLMRLPTGGFEGTRIFKLQLTMTEDLQVEAAVDDSEVCVLSQKSTGE